MFEFKGWWFPDTETHFPKMLEKSVKKGGPLEYQYRVRDLSYKFCSQYRVALDIGANVGLWARSLGQRFEHVVAFEPVSMFHECLTKNVKTNNVELQPFALGDQNSTVNMTITEGNTGHTHIDPNSIGQGNVEIRTLDSLGLIHIDYIKIDCEGYEYRVIQGGINTIQQWRPIVVLEQKPHDMYSQEYGQHAAIDLLQNLGMIRVGQVKDDWIMGWP